MITGHVAERIAIRAASEGERQAIERAIDGAITAAAVAGIREAAVRVYRASESRKCREDGPYVGSNGNLFVLIIRNGRAVTGMWRRESQPHTPEAYGVARVLTLKGV